MPPRRGFKQKKKGASSALEQALASASQAVTSGAGTGKKKGRRHSVWESDAARPGGKTSMEVLLAWLTAEGNYARWASRSAAAAVESAQQQKADGTPSPHGKRGSKTRASLIREILAAFEAEGIHRTMQDVRNRMMRIEKEYEAARKWLRETGFLLAFERGVADKDVERSVLRLCKHYRELAPRFKEVEAGKPAVTIDPDNTTDDNEDAGGQRDQEGNGGVSPAIDSDVGMDEEQDQEHQPEAEEEEEERRHEVQEIVAEDSEDEEVVGEQEEKANASDVSSSSRAEEQEEEEEEDAAAASSSTSNRADNEEEEEEEEEEEPAQKANHYEQAEESEEEEEEGDHPTRRGSFKRGVLVQSPKPKRRRLSLRSRGDSDEYQGDSNGDASDADDKARHRAVLLASAEEERDQRRELFELERAKLQRELELKEIQVAYEKTLARKKLLDAGVTLDEIDRVLPL